MYGQHNPMQPPSSPPQAGNAAYLPVQVHPENHHPLQPAPTPFLGPVSLPHVGGSTQAQGHLSTPLPPRARDVFPIDLLSPIDFDHLSRMVENYLIPAQTPIYILPTGRGPHLFQLNTGPSARDAFSVLHRLQTLIAAPLALEDFRVGLGLTLTAQRAVRQFYVDRYQRRVRSAGTGARVWRSFLKGRDLVDGPLGADLLRGHTLMRGFTRDNSGNWIIHVSDLPRMG